jgi:tagaturonate epimerase
MEDPSGRIIYPNSIVEHAKGRYFLARTPQAKQLGVQGEPAGFSGAWDATGDTLFCPLTPENAALLRQKLPWLNPTPLGMQTSAGFGDRLGLATPGHIAALTQFPGIRPVFAQQSVRENSRTGRTPQVVMDDAMWGVFEAGWREAWGADADHLKTPADCEAYMASGYTFFTIDPGDHVDNTAHDQDVESLKATLQALPWESLEDNLRDLEKRYLQRTFDLDASRFTIDRPALYRAAAKYGRAVAHTAAMYRFLVEKMGPRPFELEVSVDETDTPTLLEEHFYIALELSRLGVRWVSLAPRYVGSFEKGVDYIGDLAVFETEFARHAAVARAFGPYKLSLHSGSDKFSIYPIAARCTEGRVHLKTAGTSYLEALRTVARMEPGLFRQILAFALHRYSHDRATYHVSGRLEAIPKPESLSDDDLPELLEHFDARQALHVTFGSGLERFGGRLKSALLAHETQHYAALEAHFTRHLEPFHR